MYSNEEKQQESVIESTNLTQRKGNKSSAPPPFVDNRPEAQDYGALQMMANNSKQHEEIAQLQKMANDHADQQKLSMPKPNNTGLPDNLKSGIENLSGYSMDDVKVHYNSDKPAQLQAHAYAQGTDIHIGSGQEKHLPHEAWHVVQQKQGRVKATRQMKGGVDINDDKGLEREADIMGDKALSTPDEIMTKSNLNAPVVSQNVLQGYFTYNDSEVDSEKANKVWEYIHNKEDEKKSKCAVEFGKVSYDQKKKENITKWLKSKKFTKRERRDIHKLIGGQSIKEIEEEKRKLELAKGGEGGEKYKKYLHELKQAALKRIEEAIQEIEGEQKIPDWLGSNITRERILELLGVMRRDFNKISIDTHDNNSNAIGITNCKPDNLYGLGHKNNSESNDVLASGNKKKLGNIPAITIGKKFLNTLKSGDSNNPKSNRFHREWTIIHELSHAILGSWDIETFKISKYTYIMKEGKLPKKGNVSGPNKEKLPKKGNISGSKKGKLPKKGNISGPKKGKLPKKGNILGPNKGKGEDHSDANADTWAALVMYMSHHARQDGDKNIKRKEHDNIRIRNFRMRQHDQTSNPIEEESKKQPKAARKGAKKSILNQSSSFMKGGAIEKSRNPRLPTKKQPNNTTLDIKGRKRYGQLDPIINPTKEFGNDQIENEAAEGLNKTTSGIEGFDELEPIKKADNGLMNEGGAGHTTSGGNFRKGRFTVGKKVGNGQPKKRGQKN